MKGRVQVYITSPVMQLCGPPLGMSTVAFCSASATSGPRRRRLATERCCNPAQCAGEDQRPLDSMTPAAPRRSDAVSSLIRSCGAKQIGAEDEAGVCDSA